ncbi:MAG: DNA-binding protein [Desulfobacterales bacterium SG8_35]|nr:MAG: DNA-binding protein [Desulfobacterales bacterium SG8_35]
MQIVKVEGGRSRNTFIRLPWSLYRDDPMWVPPLIIERRMHLSSKNPYFEHATCCFWIAYRDSKPVGRISAQIDRLHLERYQDSAGFWGMLEAEDNPETFQALFDTAESWLRSKGMKCSQGPFNLSINHECGLLVEGFDTEPSVMMGHALPYYADRIEQCGYAKVKDMLAYILNTDVEPTGVRKAITRRTQNRIKTRTLRRKNFQEDLDIIFSIFNDAWSENWGFVPFTKKELVHLANDMKLLIKDDLVRIAFVDDEPSAFMVLLPNLNEAIKDLNGRLFPFGWLKLLWRLKVKSPQTGRVPLMGVLRKHQGSLLGAALAYRVIGDMQNAVIDRGIRKAEMSWILEDNVGVRGIIEDVGGRIYKTYRIFGKGL